ncbi:hypothetical protein QQ008_13035 [Fulvivirgaceae bacterium BMA10]|uniref:SMP-30/Gluconolactonase/LRE-like region domain-containing protein n=1 Tax=Splendidivirga corallicola TaxID=3051826 RepID=A0ABT8KPG4_9BACT|nr:hypothetical protein [Fulvivirgaceae bacterium BMA10]
MNKLVFGYIFILSSLIFFFTNDTVGQRLKDLQFHFQQSKEAYENKDYPSFLDHLKIADSLRPNHPTIVYNLAAAYSLNHMEKDAYITLKHLIHFNNTINFEEDKDFDLLKEGKFLEELITLKKKLDAPVKKGTKVFQFGEVSTHPEGIAYDPKTECFYISSIRQRKIFQFKNGELTDWVKEGLFAVSGIKIDHERRWLWACSSAFPEMLDFDEEDDGKAMVLKYNLETGKLIKQYAADGKHIFGDLVIHQNGDVYISDSREPKIYKIDHRNDEISLYQDFSATLLNLQGLDLSDDGESLYIADYILGLYKISLKNNKPEKLQWKGNATLKGIDGLYFYKNSLVVTQNGAEPMRVVRFFLNGAGNQIESIENLDYAREELNEPTLGTIIDNTFFYIANSPWGAYDRNGNFDEIKASIPAVYKIILEN